MQTNRNGYLNENRGAPVLPANVPLIAEFMKNEKVKKNNKKSSLETKEAYLKIVGRQKEFLPIEKEHITDVLEFCKNYSKKSNTTRKLVKMYKAFVHYYVRENNLDYRILDELAEFENPKVDYNSVKLGDLLTDEELAIIFNSAPNSRDRAMLALLLEGALRSCDISPIVWGDLVFDDLGVILNVQAKTDKIRTVRITEHVDKIYAWKKDYYAYSGIEPKGSAPLFVTLDTREAVAPSTIRNAIHRIGEHVALSKRVHSHLFKHMRVTQLYGKVPDRDLCYMIWGNENSTAIKHYHHMDPKNHDQMLLKARGIIVKKEEPAPTHWLCPKCKQMNAGNFCSICGTRKDGRPQITMPEDPAEKVRWIVENKDLINSILKS